MRRLILQNAAHVITQCAHYYKMPQSLIQNASLLQNAAEQVTVVNNKYSTTIELVLSSKISAQEKANKKN